MDTDAHVDLLGFVFVGVVDAELLLNLLRTLHGVDHGRKIHQERIPNRFDDVPMMHAHGLLNELVVDIEQAQHAGFVAAHLAAKADNVREHDRRESSLLSLYRAAGVVLHEVDYSAGAASLSICSY